MDSIRILFTALLSLFTGIMVFIFPKEVTNIVFITFLCIIIIRIISNMILWKNLKNSKKFFQNLFAGILILLISYVVYKLKSSFVLFFQISYIVFFVLDFINRIIYFIMIRKENLLKGIYYLLSAIFSIIICIFIISKNILTSYLIGLYLFEFAITYFRDFIMSITSYKIKGIRPTIPVFMALLLPYFKYKKIKILKEMNKEIKEDFEYQKPDIYISIHIGPKLYSRPGHLDICFEDEVIAFGQYDKDSLSFFKIFGDGVMYSLNDRLKYYDFVIETDKKIVFEYGFKLTEKEKNIIRERIKKLKADTVPWSSPYDYTYAHKLETTMNAKFYKFKSGKFKKYYSTRNNCVLLVDIIIKDILIDKIESGSFVIPGNYMFYFDFLSKLKNSKIVSKKIYT